MGGGPSKSLTVTMVPVILAWQHTSHLAALGTQGGDQLDVTRDEVETEGHGGVCVCMCAM